MGGIHFDSNDGKNHFENTTNVSDTVTHTKNSSDNSDAPQTPTKGETNKIYHKRH